MRLKDFTTTVRAALATLAAAIALSAQAQQAAPADTTASAVATPDSTATAAATPDSTALRTDSIATAISHVQAVTDSIARSLDASLGATDSVARSDAMSFLPAADSLPAAKKREKRDWATWRPNPQRAMWLALVLPGAGQIYNRKYWKLPIIYGGFMGCLYALSWNNMMYKDYSQAYLDIMDSDPTTESYNQFLHLGQRIDASNEERYKEIFKSRRDRYRRWRDLSFFCMIGVYALSVIDAYVDAELSEFDISKDLSLKVEPAVINNRASQKVLEASSFGIQCQLRF